MDTPAKCQMKRNHEACTWLHVHVIDYPFRVQGLEPACGGVLERQQWHPRDVDARQPVPRHAVGVQRSSTQPDGHTSSDCEVHLVQRKCLWQLCVDTRHCPAVWWVSEWTQSWHANPHAPFVVCRFLKAGVSGGAERAQLVAEIETKEGVGSLRMHTSLPPCRVGARCLSVHTNQQAVCSAEPEQPKP